MSELRASARLVNLTSAVDIENHPLFHFVIAELSSHYIHLIVLLASLMLSYLCLVFELGKFESAKIHFT